MITFPKALKKTINIQHSLIHHSLIHIGLISIALCAALLGCKEDEIEDRTIQAEAILTSVHSITDSTYVVGDQPYGQVQLLQNEDSIVVIEIFLENFNPNTLHSVHIHAGSCEQPGMHWNQGYDMMTSFCTTTSMGIPWTKPRAGDVGNVSVGYDGSGYFSIQTDLWKLGSLDYQDILGLSIVVHETHDDFVGECDPNHTHDHTHTNAKVACGTIELVP